MENKLTEDEEKAHQELVRLATDNDMYFVVWWGHFNNYFVGMRNTSKKQPEVYSAIYEMFYDVIGRKDKIVFKVSLGLEQDWPDKRLPWQKMLRVAKASVECRKKKEMED